MDETMSDDKLMPGARGLVSEAETAEARGEEERRRGKEETVEEVGTRGGREDSVGWIKTESPETTRAVRSRLKLVGG